MVKPAVSAGRYPSKMKPNETVLLLEDGEALRRMLATALGRAGLGVLEAATLAEAALALQRGAVPDVLVCDVQLPDGSGLAFAGRLRSAGDETPLVIMTGEPTAEIREEARRLGAAACLAKPFPPGVLVDAVKDAVAARKKS